LTQGPPQPPKGWGQPQQQGWGQPPPGAQGPPTQPQWGQQPSPQPPKSKPPLYRRPWFIIVGVLVALVIVGALLGDPPAEEPTGAQPEVTQAPEEPATTAEAATEAPGIGNPVRDGKFEFTVRKVECGKSRIGSADFGTRAQGQFCFVYLKVENIGKEAQLLDGSNQYMFGEGGQRYDADTEAAIYLDDAQTFLEEINPGNSVDGIVVFDIPKSATPARLELHDSAFSGGVDVKL
jgi:hypothetical protein